MYFYLFLSLILSIYTFRCVYKSITTREKEYSIIGLYSSILSFLFALLVMINK